MSNEIESLKQDIDSDQLSAAVADSRMQRTNGRISILHAKPFYFDSDLVRGVDACRTNAENVSAYQNCIRRHLHMESINDETLHRWARVPELTYRLESGVREAPFSPTQALHLDESLATAAGACPAEALHLNGVPFPAENAIGPLCFKIHVTFLSPPLFAPDKAAVLEDDKSPYGFPLGNDIVARVDQLIAHDPSSREALAHMIAFTQAQRFFRAAFNGDLGPAFPIDRLTQLAQSLAAPPQRLSTHTPRWLTKPNKYVEVSILIHDDLENASSSQKPEIAHLAQKMDDALSACVTHAIDNAARIHGLVFDDSSCSYSVFTGDIANINASQACSDDSAACTALQNTYALLQIMRLRHDLNVAQDDQL